MGGTEHSGDEGLHPREILIIETHQDHAELIAGALEEALMGVRVTRALEPPAGIDAPPESVIISMAQPPEPILAWLDACQSFGRRPRVFLISGPEGPWQKSTVEGIQPQGQFDKSRGARFLEALVLGVASRSPDTLQVQQLPPTEVDPSDEAGEPGQNPGAAVAPAPPRPTPGTGLALLRVDRDGVLLAAAEGSAEALGVDPDKLLSGADLNEVLGRGWRDLSADGWNPIDPHGLRLGRIVRIADACSVLIAGPAELLADGDQAELEPGAGLDGVGLRHAVATSILARELREILGVLSSLSDLTHQGGLGRQTGLPSRYAANIEQEVTRARAIVRRLEAIHAPSQASARAELFLAHDLLALRQDGWRFLLPAQVELQLEDRSSGASIRIRPGVIGPALDALVRALGECVAPAGDLLLTTSTVALDEEFCGAHPGSTPGRFVRIRLEARRRPDGKGAGSEPRALHESVLELGIAAVKAHGGYLRSEHHAGRSLLDAYLPIERSFEVESRSRQPTVLCVDDEPSVRGVCTEVLGEAGYRTVEVESGEEAVNLYMAGCRYDLVLLDYAMEGIDGARTFDYLRSADPGVRVVLCTGSPYLHSVERMLAKGLLGMVVKPFRLNRLLDMVSAALGRPSVRAAGIG